MIGRIIAWFADDPKPPEEQVVARAPAVDRAAPVVIAEDEIRAEVEASLRRAR